MRSDSVWSKHFIQTADIDAAESDSWNNEKGLYKMFTPNGITSH